jgi:hypothetical protein
MSHSEHLRCCFCGATPTGDEYVELRLRIDRSPARQSFGAHRACMEDRLASGFTIELDPLEDE